MAELYQQEKLQPSLLDRLTDDTLVEIIRDKRIKPDASATDANKNEADQRTSMEHEQINPAVEAKTDRFTISSRKLRELVIRDLAWLLNTTSLDATVDLSEFPFVASSVINYGTPALTGSTLSNIDTYQLERRIKTVILNFEPRILKDTLSINVSKHDSLGNRALSFEIECDIWGQPAPEHLQINTDIDLDTGNFSFKNRLGR